VYWLTGGMAFESLLEEGSPRQVLVGITQPDMTNLSHGHTSCNDNNATRSQITSDG